MTIPFDDPIPGSTLPDGSLVVSPKVISHASVRRSAPLHGYSYLSLGIQDPDGNPVDPDPGTVVLEVYFNDGTSVYPDSRGSVVLTANETTNPPVTHPDVGKFDCDVGPPYTDNIGMLRAEWKYFVNGTEFKFVDNMQILEQMPMWSTLTEPNKLIVEKTSWYFADLFDSTTGGPWLQENFQTHYGHERIAFLMDQAVMKFNVIGFPVTSFGVGVDDEKIPANFSPLMTWATKLEVIRHLMLSYTEQPQFVNMATTYTDRRDYLQRWEQVLEEEKPQYEQAVKMAKRALIGLSKGSLLVAGGIFGGSARGYFQSGIYAMHTRAFRFYPAAPSVSWASQAFSR